MVENWWFQILVEFGASFAGVVAGFLLAYWYDRKKRHIENINLKINILNAIKKELELNVTPPNRVKKGGIIIPFIPYVKNALNSAIGAGYFSLLDPDTQRQISWVYALFRQHERVHEISLGEASPHGMPFDDWLDYLEPILYDLRVNLKSIFDEVPKLIEYIDERIIEFKKELGETIND